jgi:hypothetical protein
MYGSDVVGIFNDKGEFKQKSFHFILDVLIDSNLFVNKKECGLAIKNELKSMYSMSEYSFSYHGHKFSKFTNEINKIHYIYIPKQYSVDTKFILYNIDQLNEPLPMLGFTDLIVSKK